MQIGLVVVHLPNCLVANYKCGVSIVPATDLIVQTVHLFVGDKLGTHFALFLSSDRSVL